MADPQNKHLVIFEMANNHMGDLNHGIKIVEEFAAVAEKYPAFRYGMKLQYRDPSFVAPCHRGSDIPIVKRFESTDLGPAGYLALKQAISAAGFQAVCTPWDEPSVDLVEAHGYDYIKVASCSICDWPLLERIGRSPLAVIASVGGAGLEDMDRVVAYFRHRGRDLTLLHCVGRYPAEDHELQLGQISLLRRWYPEVPIGLSSHERPDCREAIGVALGLGAVVLEKHVGVPTETIKLNAYSMNPQQAAAWLAAGTTALAMLGSCTERVVSDAERAHLRGLMRGVWAAEDIPAGAPVGAFNTYLGFPPGEDQLLASQLGKYLRYVAERPIAAGQPVNQQDLSVDDLRDMVLDIVRDVGATLATAGVVIPEGARLELAHHYGLARFREAGAAFVDAVNREYCKRIIVLLPGQAYPDHVHHGREETLIALAGTIGITINGEEHWLQPGQMARVVPETSHSFRSETGGVIEEITTSYVPGDSAYADPAIPPVDQRKTFIEYWRAEDLPRRGAR